MGKKELLEKNLGIFNSILYCAICGFHVHINCVGALVGMFFIHFCYHPSTYWKSKNRCKTKHDLFKLMFFSSIFIKLHNLRTVDFFIFEHMYFVERFHLFEVRL